MNEKRAKALRRQAAEFFKVPVSALRASAYHEVETVPQKRLTLVLDSCPRKLYNQLKRAHNIERRDICSSHSTLSLRSTASS